MNNINDRYDYIGEFHQGVAIVVKDDLYGAILVGGHEIIAPVYDYISPFNDGYAQAFLKGEFKILNLAGQECKIYNDKLIVIPTKYDCVREFNDGYACVKLNGLWGAIDTQGREIFEPQFYYLSDFIGGTAKYKKEKTNVPNSWGFVHADGFCSKCNIEEPIIEDDGNIVVKKRINSGVETFMFNDRVLTRYIYSEEETVRINHRGQLVIKNDNAKVTLPEGFILARDFSCGLACVLDSTGYWGYINLDGKIIIPLEYKEAQGFNENRAFVCDKNDKWRLISTNGTVIKTFDNISTPFPFEKGYSIARTNADKHVILDLNGNEVSSHFDGLVSHTDKSNEFEIDYKGLKGYYNVTTKLFIEPRFEKILEVHKDYVKIEVQNIGKVFADFAGKVFIEGSPRIYVPDWCLGAKSLTDEIYLGISKDKKYGLIGSKGETLCEPVIEDISEVDGDIVVIERFCKKKTYISSDGTLKYGLYDIKRKVLIPADYDTRPELKDGYYLISKNDLFGILDLDGQHILKPEWKSITLVDDCFLVSKIVKGCKEYYGLVSQKGNVIIEPDYNEIAIMGPSIYKARYGEKWIIYNKNGKLTKESFDEVSLDGDTFMVKSYGRDGRINERGKKIVKAEDGTYLELPSKFRWGYDFNDRVARVDVFSFDGRDVKYQNHVDTSFNIVISDNDSIVTVDESVDYIYDRNRYGIYIYVSGDKYGLLSPEGKILVKAGYDEIRTISDGLYIASILEEDRCNMKSGVIDVTGNVIIDFQYFYLEPFYGRVVHSYISPDIKIGLKDIEIPEKIEHLLIYNYGLGLIDLKGNVCIPTGHKDIQKTEYGFILKKDNKYGYAALDYSIICEPKYASIEEVGNGFKRISVSTSFGPRYGIMDQSGKECLEPIYISIGNMNNDGEADIIAPGMKYGTVDRNYNIVKKPCEREIQSSFLFSDNECYDFLSASKVISNRKFGRNIGRHEFAAEGLVWIHEEETEKIGLATEGGEILIEPRYGKVEPFINGLAKVNTGYWYKDEEYDKDDFPHWKYTRRYVDGEWGVINTLGQEVIPTNYSSIQIEEDGTYIVSKRVAINQREDCVVGLMTGCRLNKDGELIIKNVNGEYILADKKFDWQSDFDSVGRSEVNYHGDFGYVNKEFRLIVPNGISGTDNDIVVPEEFDWWYEYVDGLIVVIDKDGKYGVIDIDGQTLIAPIYEQIKVLRKNENILFNCGKLNDLNVFHWRLADIKGNIVTVSPYIKISRLGENLLVAETEQNKFAILDNQGRETIDILFDTVHDFDISTTIPPRNYYDNPQKIENQKYAIVGIGGLYGLIDKQGKLVIVPKYKSLTILEDGCFWGDDVLYDVNERRVIVNGNSVMFIPNGYFNAELLDNGLILVSNINKYGCERWGCVNQVGTIIIPTLYHSLSYSAGLLLASICNDDDYLERTKKSGVINFKNEIIVPFSDEYEEIQIKENLILLKNKHYYLWGAYTREGKLICEPMYNEMVPVSKYFIKAFKEEENCLYHSEKCGIIDFAGNEILPFEFDWIADELDNGLLKIQKGSMYGFIDIMGNLLLEPSYLSIGDFNHGYAIVAKEEEFNHGVIDSMLNEIIPCYFSKIEYIEESHLFETENGYKDPLGRYHAESNGKEILVPSKYSYCEPFNNGFAIAVLNKNWHTEHYGLINDKAADVLPPIFEHLILLDNGLYKFKLNGKYGLIDNNGNIILPNKYHAIGEFIDNLACVRVSMQSVDSNKENNLYGYVNLQGKEILTVEYEFIGKRFSNRAVVMKEGKWWLFGIDDHTLIAFPEIAYLGPCVSDDLCKVNIGGKYDKGKNRVTGGLWGYCSVDGKTVVEAVYESAYSFSEGLAAVNKNGKWGFINSSGEVVVPCKYDEVDSSYKNGSGRLTSGQEVFVFDSKGNLTERYAKENNDDYYETYDDDTPSIYDNPYYNDNIDMDQQSIEFWNSL